MGHMTMRFLISTLPTFQGVNNASYLASIEKISPFVSDAWKRGSFSHKYSIIWKLDSVNNVDPRIEKEVDKINERRALGRDECVSMVILLEKTGAFPAGAFGSLGILHKKHESFCSKMSKGTCKMRKSCV